MSSEKELRAIVQELKNLRMEIVRLRGDIKSLTVYEEGSHGVGYGGEEEKKGPPHEEQTGGNVLVEDQSRGDE